MRNLIYTLTIGEYLSKIKSRKPQLVHPFPRVRLKPDIPTCCRKILLRESVMTKICLLTLSCLLLVGCSTSTTTPFPPESLVFADLDGNRYSVAQLRSRGVLIHYWATWCATCVAEIQNFDILAPRLKKVGIELLLIAVSDSTDNVKEFGLLGRSRLPFYVDLNNSHRDALGLRGLPVTVLMSRTGDLIPFEDPIYRNKVTKLHGARDWQRPGIEKLFESAIQRYEHSSHH